MSDFLFVLNYMILGFVQGFCEFLPISSSGHLLIVEHWLNYSSSTTDIFDIFLQLISIIVAVFYFRKEVWQIMRGFIWWGRRQYRSDRALGYGILLAMLPAIALGPVVYQFISGGNITLLQVGYGLVAGGLALLLTEWRYQIRKHRPKITTLAQLSLPTCLLIGCGQVLAMYPGVSRSAATIIIAMLCGASRLNSVRFSFLLAMPTMVAATAFSCYQHYAQLSAADLSPLAWAAIPTLIGAILSIRLLFWIVTHHSLKPFGYYRLLLGALLISGVTA